MLRLKENARVDLEKEASTVAKDLSQVWSTTSAIATLTTTANW